MPFVPHPAPFFFFLVSPPCLALTYPLYIFLAVTSSWKPSLILHHPPTVHHLSLLCVQRTSHFFSLRALSTLYCNCFYLSELCSESVTFKHEYVSESPAGCLLIHRLLYTTLRVSDSVAPGGWGVPQIHIYRKFSGDADATGPWLYFVNRVVENELWK